MVTPTAILSPSAVLSPTAVLGPTAGLGSALVLGPAAGGPDLGFAALFAADPVAFHGAAVAWAALAEELDRAFEQFDRGRGQVDRGWPSGPAGQAALDRLTAQGHELSNAHPPARRIADALEHHAYAVGELRVRAEEALLAAGRAGLLVDRSTGAITVLGPDTAGEADVLVDKRVTRLAGELADLLDRARRLDRATAAAVRANLPAPGSGFGAQRAWTVDRATVAGLSGRSPTQVQAWWQGLTPEQQDQVVRDWPDLVGALDGVPATDRDRANRVNLDHQLGDARAREADLDHRLAAARLWYPLTVPVLQSELAAVRTTEFGLLAVRDQLDRYGDQALLLGIDGAGDGKAIVALGDPDTARDTAVFVPGVNTDLRDIGGDLDRVRNLRQAADNKTTQPDQVAVVYWLGYDTPGYTGALGDGASRAGAAAFTPFVDGLRATHQLSADHYHVTAIGHSYGSTVIADAALGGQLHVDDIIAAGSPGMHTDHAADLHLDPRHVWGGLADGDPIGGGLGDLPGVHGQEPTDPAFGDNRFEVDTYGHSAYWTVGSQSLNNQADIILGRYGQVGYYYGSPPAS